MLTHKIHTVKLQHLNTDERRRVIFLRRTCVTILLKAVQYLKRLDAGFPPRRPGFVFGQYFGFVVDKAALG
jgi:hypothetical protein